eukprot:symbB.v1.2.007023.t1/scaffold427.1/size208084/5
MSPSWDGSPSSGFGMQDSGNAGFGLEMQHANGMEQFQQTDYGTYDYGAYGNYNYGNYGMATDATANMANMTMPQVETSYANVNNYATQMDTGHTMGQYSSYGGGFSVEPRPPAIGPVHLLVVGEKSMAKILGLLEIGSILLVGLGAYVAFGPYHDDRTWNLMRNSADIKVIKLPSQEPTHFRLYALSPGKQRTTDPALLFVPGHGGSWKQGINLCAYLAKEAFNFYVADFHASASALHWTVLSAQASFTAAAIQHLAERHAGPKILLGHSMGGRVALEALLVDNRLHDVDALILISTPTESHPLLLEPRFAPKAYNLSQTMDVYALSGGATDPLVPMRSCHIARPLLLGSFLPWETDKGTLEDLFHSPLRVMFTPHSAM